MVVIAGKLVMVRIERICVMMLMVRRVWVVLGYICV